MLATLGETRGCAGEGVNTLERNSRSVRTHTTQSQVRCFASKGSAPRQLGREPLQAVWDQPEDPNYILPPPEPKDSDFAKVVLCKVFSSKLGYRLRVTGSKQNGFAVKKLDKPITGKVTFKAHMKAAPGIRGFLSNGYLVFGDGPDEASLVHCGAQLRIQRARIIQGTLSKGRGEAADVKAPEAKGLAIKVTVDLDKQTVSYTGNDATLEAKLVRPMKAITHIGYSMNRSVIDFGPIQIERE